MSLTVPFLLRDPKYVAVNNLLKKQAQDRAKAAQALADQKYDPPKGLLGGKGLTPPEDDLAYLAGNNYGAFKPPKQLADRPSIGGALRDQVGQMTPNAVTASLPPETHAPLIGELLSGNRFVKDITGGHVNPEDLPGPLSAITDVAASPLTLATAGIGGLEAGSARGIGSAIARKLALETASGIVGIQGGQAAEGALPGGTPNIIKSGVGLAAGAVAGGGVYGLLRNPKGAARGIETVTQALKSKGLLTADAKFGGAGMQSVVDEFDHFPSKQELQSSMSDIRTQAAQKGVYDTTEDPKIQEFGSFLANYDNLRRVHDATVNELNLGPGLADLGTKEERISSLKNERDPLYARLRATKDGSPEETAIRKQIYDIGTKIEAVRNEEWAVGSGTPMSELKAINDVPRYSTASDQSIISDIKTLTDQLEGGKGLNQADMDFFGGNGAGLRATTQLRDLHVEAARRGLNVADEMDKFTSPETAPNKDLPQFDTQASQPLLKEATGLVHLDDATLRSQYSRIEASGLPASDQRILKSTYEREMGNRPSFIVEQNAGVPLPKPTKQNLKDAVNPVKINNALRQVGTLLDNAVYGRLITAAVKYPKQYASAAKAAFSSDESFAKISQGLEDAANASERLPKLQPELTGTTELGMHKTGGVLPTRIEAEADYKIPMVPESTSLPSKMPGLRSLSKSPARFLNTIRMMALHQEITSRLASGMSLEELARPETKLAIGKAINLVTGESGQAWTRSGVAKFTIMFPNWLASQADLVIKAATDGTITGDVARSSLTRLIVLGSAATATANIAQEALAGGSTKDILTSPIAHTRNGIPMAKIPDSPLGSGLTVDMFGPIGEIISKAAGVGKAAYQGNEDSGPVGGIGNALQSVANQGRSYLAPVPSLVVNNVSGSDVVGNSLKTPEERLTNLIHTALPFNIAGPVEGRAPIAAVAGALGAKVHQKSPINQALYDAGITTDDPDYLIKRKDYLLAHPDLGSTEANKVQADIIQRRQANELATTNNTQSLKAFRDNRSTLLQEQRDKLQVLLGNKISTGSSKQEDWLNSYFTALDSAQDPVTHKIDSNLADPAIADWTNKNGAQALDFVNRYMGAGLGPVESAYFNDLRKLDADGYFNMPKFQHMRSGLSDDDIIKYSAQVSAYRASDPKLQSQPMALSARKVLPNLSQTELADVVNSTKSAYQNPDLQKYKDSHRKELMWFNQNANWSTYQNTKNGTTKGQRTPTKATHKLGAPVNP